MGQWNGTCAISQLPILKDEPAMLVLLVQSLYADISENEGRDMLCGPNSMWMPRALPIRGTYDGYGRIKPDDPDHWTIQLALARFRLDLVERETGERNPMQEPAVVLSEVMNGHDPSWSREPLSGIMWLQELVHKDRLRVHVPAWLDSEEDRTKIVTTCLVRADIYDTLASHFTDDNFGNGRRPEYTIEQVQKALKRSVRLSAKIGHHEDKATVEAFVEPRQLGHARRLMERTRKLLGDDLDDDTLGESMESMAKQRLRDTADRFAEDYGSHLLSAGVSWDDPIIESIITEVAAFIHVGLHMELLNKFWHPQPNGAEGWLSHAAIAMKTIELVKRHAREDE